MMVVTKVVGCMCGAKSTMCVGLEGCGLVGMFGLLALPVAAFVGRPLCGEMEARIR